MMTISTRALAAASWGNLVPLETQQSLYAVAMAMAAFKAFSVSSLDFHCLWQWGTELLKYRYEEEQF
jgi:hypothetical protein